MITIKQLHLINWMYYDRLDVAFERGNLLTGITGSGKSSMVDAMQVILLGQTGGRSFFNKSATGTRSDRTLVTYLRGKYHDKEYKRPDKAFSSYLFLDFFDEINREMFSFGVVFDFLAVSNIFISSSNLNKSVNSHIFSIVNLRSFAP